MLVLNTGPDQEVVENIRLDFAMILTSGKGVLQQSVEVHNLLELYLSKGFINKYQDIRVTPDEVGATVFCPSRKRISIKLPP